MEQEPKRGNEKERELNKEQNLLANPVEAIRAMALIEGPGWADIQERAEQKISEQELTDPNVIEDVAHDTLPAALAKLRAIKEGDKEGDTPVRLYTIYGNGGLNHYYVFSDGSVKFSERNAGSPQDLQRAKELGFEVQ